MRSSTLCLSLFCLAAVFPAHADDASAPVTLSLKDHHFTPAEVTIPANARVEFDVTNNDATPAEFESDDFSAEKVLPSGQAVKINIGPLKPGTYEFHDEYNEDESKARLTVK
jgi:heme/copper-type cytochrome/quinol oxidase subunit 2